MGIDTNVPTKTLLQKVALIHECEEVIINRYNDDQMKTPMHMSRGDENCVVGVVEAFLPDSYFFGYYRTHSLFLAITGDPKSFFGEMLGRACGANQGIAGSMHINAPKDGLLATSAIVSSTIPLALGGGIAAITNGDKKYSVVFFGDGAIEEGVFHETLNMASLYELPILFVCLDNGLAVDITPPERQGYRSIRDLVYAYKCEYLKITQPDVLESYLLSLEARKLMDTYRGPVFLHMECYRYLQHIGVSTDFETTPTEFERPNYRSPKMHIDQLEKIPLEKSRIAAIEAGLDTLVVDEILASARLITSKSYEEALLEPTLPIETILKFN